MSAATSGDAWPFAQLSAPHDLLLPFSSPYPPITPDLLGENEESNSHGHGSGGHSGRHSGGHGKGHGYGNKYGYGGQKIAVCQKVDQVNLATVHAKRNHGKVKVGQYNHNSQHTIAANVKLDAKRRKSLPG